MRELEFDYIVVGAGASGCTVAARLAEDSAMSVGVFEAGGMDDDFILKIPGANVVTGAAPAYNWAYETEPVPALGNRRLYWAQGRVVGGSSSINGMMYLRGYPSDYENWKALGCEGWGYEDVLRCYRKSETNERGESAVHGASGPLQVASGLATAPVCDLFLEAARSAGYPITGDLNAADGEAFGHVDLTVGRGRRSSAASAYLHPALTRGNVTLVTKAQTLRIIIEGERARGIEYLHDGERKIARARREVILSGGAVNSPQLLMLSGIGDAAELAQHGIKAILDRPEVGRNLQNHPMYRLIHTVTQPVSAYSHARPLGAMRAGLQYMFSRSGVLSRGLFPTGGFLQADDGRVETTIQVCMAPAPVVRRKPGVLGILPKEHGFTLLLNHGSPFSRGSVRLKSADPLHHAAIFPDYFSDARDMEILVRGVQKVQRILAAKPLSDILGREIQPLRPTRTADEIEADIRATALTHYHAVGTCRMGADANAVVDPKLRVNGVEGLRVVDASIMPVLVNGNTYAASVMIGERAAELIRAG